MADADVRTPDEAPTRGRPFGHRGNIIALAVSGVALAALLVALALGVGKPRSIHAGVEPFALAVTPNSRTLYVANYFANTVTPVNVATGNVGTPIPAGHNPQALAVTPEGRILYVADFLGNTVTPVDVATGKPGTPITVGNGPEGLAITPDGRTL
jgi:hyaluronoglucosaminidase